MIDITKEQKIFCDNIKVGFTKEFFIMGLMSGEAGSSFSLTPQHVKRLKQYLENQINIYEKQFGEIVTEPWEPGIKSPIQINNKK